MNDKPLSWEELRQSLLAFASDEQNLADVAELVSNILPIYLEESRAANYFEFWQQKGFHLTPVHYYQPVPDTRTLPDELWDTRSQLPGIDMNESSQLEFLRNVFPLYSGECDQFATGPTESQREFFFNNGSMDGMDALVLYCMVRHFKPDLVLEVGAGFSSLLIARAALANKNTRLVCIEPYPSDLLVQGFPGLHTLIPIRVQDAGFGLFQQLKANDILFIDSSHVVNCGSDVNCLLLEVLPRLNPGVIVHLHDIFLPNEVPRDLVKSKHFFWTEQYLLQAFLAFNSEFEVLFANEYMAQRHSLEAEAAFPNSPWLGGGSFWIRRKMK